MYRMNDIRKVWKFRHRSELELCWPLRFEWQCGFGLTFQISPTGARQIAR